jgi:transposase
MLFIGDDWAEDHHDVAVHDEDGRGLRVARLVEGVEGVARLHELVAQLLPDDATADQVVVCIETDRGPWVRALVAAGYQVYGVNPEQAARHRELVVVSGAKSDKADAHALADMVRTRRHLLRPVAADSDIAEAVKVVARAHQTLIWERTRHMLRLRTALREYFPAALSAYRPLTLTGADTLQLLAKAPTPTAAARLTITRISTALRKAHRRDVPARPPRSRRRYAPPHLGQPDIVTGAYAATVRAAVAIITTLNTEIATMQGQVEAHFRKHPDAEVHLSQPGIGVITGARVLAEFGDAPGRYTDARSRKNYAGTAPITRQSGKTKTVHARFIHNNRLIDALHVQASCAILHDTAVRAYYDQLRDRGLGHPAALRQIGNRLVGILHGCLTSHTHYDQATAWAHRTVLPTAA